MNPNTRNWTPRRRPCCHLFRRGQTSYFRSQRIVFAFKSDFRENSWNFGDLHEINENLVGSGLSLKKGLKSKFFLTFFWPAKIASSWKLQIRNGHLFPFRLSSGIEKLKWNFGQFSELFKKSQFRHILLNILKLFKTFRLNGKEASFANFFIC